MSTSIPFDPSLTLGNIVPEDHLTVLDKISTLQTPIDNALDLLNSSIMLKRKLKMTMQELVNLQVDTTEVSKSMDDVSKSIGTAASEYAKVCVKNMPEIAKEKANIPQVSHNIESPIDYNRSQIKQLPLSSDSLTMDAQYFSFDETGQSSDSAMSSLKSFVSASTSFLGNKRSAEATASTMSQVNHQREQHGIQGTLVITANCTHKMADIFAPFFIDVDKGIRAWNELFPDDMIKTNDPASIAKIAEEQQTQKEKFFNLLSGATFGSSFVGMVHVLKESKTQSSQAMYSAAASLQAQMEVGSWFSSFEGGFGVSSSFSNSAKRLLSSQQISSHVSLVTMGIIPTIEANDVQLAVKQFSQFDPAEMMGKLADLQNATASEQASVTSAAQNARTGGQMMSIEAAKIKSVMSSVSEHQDGSNKMLDINSLMTAFTDFVNKAIAGNVGVPINFYLKPITASQLAQMWVAKYFPGKYVTSAGDDSTPEEPKENTGGGDSGN
ncbi:hypothetical protein [Marinibactrum halimedae]|uniref:Uncharacterized protein n=1 Tax=Marinibactrum halimedae TaxID=1444977 RepID=A0AA37T079_9GAMM|nr:hypothetical protein [Marinibactrum halimedae]MCD9460895.1 hypothetical protein [Marinibactrum halimedae]GLS24569.1 hypothetical protein GCM10007877_02830 [Marinibactrum halimedae]